MFIFSFSLSSKSLELSSEEKLEFDFSYSEEISSISVNYYDKSWEINEILMDENFDPKTGEGIFIPAETKPTDLLRFFISSGKEQGIIRSIRKLPRSWPGIRLGGWKFPLIHRMSNITIISAEYRGAGIEPLWRPHICLVITSRYLSVLALLRRLWHTLMKWWLWLATLVYAG